MRACSRNSAAAAGDRGWPRIAYRDAMLVRHRQARPAQPDRDAGVSRAFRRLRLQAIFASLLEQDGTEVRAIPAPGGGSRKFCDRMNAFAQKEGLPGMGYIFWREGEGGAAVGRRRPAGQEHRPRTDRGDPPATGPGRKATRRSSWAGKPQEFEGRGGPARDEIGREKGLTDEDRFAFAWIVDFPMYERTRRPARSTSRTTRFRCRRAGMEALERSAGVLGYQYDLACNGYELVSGAIRNHKPEIMFKAFEIAGYGEDEVRKRFGGMVNAFRYGAPPHGGCAAGIDRIVMLLAGTANIREVIMFPMNQRAEDLMMGAPSPSPSSATSSARQPRIG
jgi:aspartyl-tRNA synthetase